MASSLDICNLALQKIGDAPITALSGTDAKSVRVNRVYEMCRDIVLGEDAWAFAISRKALTLLSSDINGLAYFAGGDMFVAVGNKGLIYTSLDNGSTWDRAVSGTGFDLHGVCVATVGTTSTIIVVGKHGTIITSSDGITWTARTSGTNKNLYSVTGYTDNIVAVGAGGCILSTTDVATWTSRTSGVDTNLRGVCCYSGTPLFVAVGDAGVILTSADMSTWASRTSGVSTALKGVFYGSALYVAVGNSGVIRTSSDGTTWSAGTSGITGTIYSGAYAEATYFAVAAGGKLLTSADGTVWTAVTNDAVDDLTCIAYSTADDSWVMAGELSELHTSADGTTWEAVAIAPAWGYDYEFALPGDCLRILGVSNDDEEDSTNTFEYKVEAGRIITDEDTIYLRYVSQITDTALFPWWFVDTLALKIAVELSEVQAKSAALTQDLRNQYMIGLMKAQQYNNADLYVEHDTGKPLWVDEGR